MNFIWSFKYKYVYIRMFNKTFSYHGNFKKISKLDLVIDNRTDKLYLVTSLVNRERLFVIDDENWGIILDFTSATKCNRKIIERLKRILIYKRHLIRDKYE